jgi:secretion/DNA translocation related TadE-like protein
MSERGSVTLIVAAALGFSAVITAFAADTTLAVGARTRAQAAADAAALGAAQELVAASGQSPAAVAAEYAERSGARLVSCRCDPSSDEIVVRVELEVRLPLLAQVRTVEARARAVLSSGALQASP